MTSPFRDDDAPDRGPAAILEEARAIARRETRLMATTEHVSVLWDELEQVQSDYAARGEQLDAKEQELAELRAPRVPAAGPEHPASRAVHSVTGALQILLGMANLNAAERLDACSSLQRLLEEVPADVAALYQQGDAKDVEITELREQGIRDKQYIDRIEARNTALNEQLIAVNNRLAAASREVEQLLQQVSIRLQTQTSEFNRVRSIRDTLDAHVTDIGGAGDYVIINEPRAAAAGA